MIAWITLLLSIAMARPSHALATPVDTALGTPAAGAYAKAYAARSERNRVDSIATHARAVLAISEFFLEWQRLWRASAAVRATLPGGATDRELRLPYLHCHPDAESGTRAPTAVGATKSSESFARHFAQYSLVESDHSQFSACPSWILNVGVREAQDERAFRDGALISAMRPAARSARARLLATLDSAAALQAGSGFFTGQQVRFRVEQGDLDGAAYAARNCRAERWWCLALSAYVLERGNTWLESEATFRAMQQALPADDRCAWNDVGDLLAPAEQSAYGKLRCADRTSVHEHLWWLADPLFRERGNERWVAHQSRRVDVALRSALHGDERYVWNTERGGDAMARLIVRYDWPTYTWWDNRATDDSHSSYLRLHLSVPVPPYTTFEYSLDRAHLVPAWNAVATPFGAREADWDLARLAPDGEPDPGWWAAELFRTPRRLVQLPTGQTAMFRRQSNIAVAIAHRLRQPLMQRAVDGQQQRFDVMLLASTSANDIDTLAQRTAAAGASVVLRGTLTGAPVVMAFEAMGMGSTIDARTRFGVQPPVTLSAMKPGEVAISDAALLDGDAMANDRQVPDESLLEHMLGSLSLERGKRRLGVYWETYGIAPQDTVTISLSMQGDAEVSGLRRLGMALNVASDPNRSLTTRWTEPNPQRYTRTLAGEVPVQLRSIMLNLGQLTPGPYLLRISVERAGAPVVSSQRRVVLEP